MADDQDLDRELKTTRETPTSAPRGLRDQLANLHRLNRSMRAMAEPPGKLNTTKFTPLTYVEEPPIADTAPAPSRPPDVDSPSASPVRSGGQVETLREQVLAFQERLGEAEEVGLHLAHFGAPMVLRVGRVSAAGADLVSISGRLDASDEECQLVMHVSQLNVILVRCKAPEGREPLRLA